jgi:hypothetical protein
MSVINFIKRLELVQNCSSLDRHELEKDSGRIVALQKIVKLTVKQIANHRGKREGEKYE